MKKLTPLKAIRKKCLECCEGSVKEIRLCPSTDCALHEYRLGKNPSRAGIGGRRLVKNTVPENESLEKESPDTQLKFL